MLISPEQGFSVVGPDGKMTQEFAALIEELVATVNALSVLTGTGTPDGSVVASVGRWYVDTSAAAGTGIYFKETGDGNTGWIQRS